MAHTHTHPTRRTVLRAFFEHLALFPRVGRAQGALGGLGHGLVEAVVPALLALREFAFRVVLGRLAAAAIAAASRMVILLAGDADDLLGQLFATRRRHAANYYYYYSTQPLKMHACVYITSACLAVTAE